MLFSVIDLPDSIYRLLAVRYLFLLYLAWIWVRDGIVINKVTTLFSFLSFLSIIYFEYLSVDDEVLSYDTREIDDMIEALEMMKNSGKNKLQI